MNCPACGHTIEARAKFCSECGVSLVGSGQSAVGSPSPLTANRVTANPLSYTPRHLADKILTSRAALEGERKHVTVMFADVKSSLELAEQVEAETWHAILDRFFAILADGIHGVEGTINQYTGDGIMALFGAPIAHEDHAQRACHAALGLRTELRRYADTLRMTHGLSFSVRMGLNSGEVVVGRIGDDLRMDYTAQGHTVGLAARMEQLAEPGTVLLTAHTARLVSGYFTLRELGPAQVKGLSPPLHVFELEGPGPLRTRLDRSRARGFATFVGRGAEMTVLDTALKDAIEGTGAVVGVEGDAGVGKSRLCGEFVSRCRARGLSIYEAHCPSHGRTVPYLPILALLRSYFGIVDRDTGAAARERVAGRLLVRDDSVREALPVLYDFLGIADPAHPPPRMDPEARQRQLFGFIRRLVDLHQGEETVLLFVDDVHWIDPASEVFIAQLVSAVPGTRTLVLLNYRPEYGAPWMGQSWFRRLELAPLPHGAAGAMLDELLGTDPALAPLRAIIHERTGGNPFFIEEVVQALLNDGTLERQPNGLSVRRPVTEIRIPDTVHAVLAARIDRLVESDKAILQTAAVIGKAFDREVLRRVLNVLGEEQDRPLETALQRLSDAGLILGDAADSDEPYTFKHPLTHDVAYRSQLAVRRQLVHRSVANVLQELDVDKLDEVAALLAHHFEQAGAGIDAARWHRKAAEWAGVSDMAEAARHSRQILALTANLPESPETDPLRHWAGIRLLNLGWRSGMSPDEARELFTEGMRLADRTSDLRVRAGFLNSYGIVVGMSGDVDGGMALVAQGAQLARETGDPVLRLVTSVALVQAQTMAGTLHAADQELADTLTLGSRNLDLGSASLGFSPFLYLLMMRAHVNTETGRLRDAAADLERLLAHARERGEIELLGWAHEFAAYLALAVGSSTDAMAHARQSLDRAEKIGSPLSRASAWYAMGGAQLAAEDWDEAATAFGRGVEIIRASGTGRHWESRGLSLLAHALAGAGRLDQAHTTVAEAEAESLRNGDRSFECISCLAIARAHRLADGIAVRTTIEVNLARVERLAATTGAHLYVPYVHEERAALAAAQGDLETQRHELRAAQRLFAAIGADLHAARLAKLITPTAGGRFAARSQTTSDRE